MEVEFNNQDQFDRMIDYYAKTKDVPNLEHLWVGKNPVDELLNRIKLVPVGCNVKPKTISELTKAIKQIGNCLSCLHEIGFVHCDVRWSNIVVTTESNYVLIDSEHACRCDDNDLLTVRSGTIRKEYVMDNSKPWCSRFDYYQMGLLLDQQQLEGVELSPELSDIRDQLLDRTVLEGKFFDEKFKITV